MFITSKVSWLEQKSTQIKPQFLLSTVWKCQKPQLINFMISFLSLWRCLQVYLWSCYLNFHKPSRVFYVMSTYNKTMTDYMEYSSKMAENHVCRWNLQFSIEKQTEQACNLTERRAFRFEKTTIKAFLKKINTFEHKLTLTKLLPALDVAF